MELPKKAKVAFDGKFLRVYSWKQKLFDGSFATFERAVKADAVVIMATTTNNRIVMIKDEQPMRKTNVGMVGGSIDRGEKPADSAKRELLEETGYVSDDWELLKLYHPASHMIHYSTYFVVARGCRKVQEQHTDPGERIEVREVGLPEFMRAIEKYAVNQSGIAMELYYAYRLHPKAFKAKIFSRSKKNPMKIDERELADAKKSFFKPTEV